MYCINCGVKLADSEKVCPLCDTRVYHPDIKRNEGDMLYPKKKTQEPRMGSFLSQLIFTMAFALCVTAVMLCNLQLNGGITWSGYVTGAMVVAYTCIILPFWFKKPNPVIFVPCGFASVIVYSLYICLVTGGNWFLPFAFPVIGGVMLIITAVVALTYYLKHGKLYIIGGALIALGAHTLLSEFLLDMTFNIGRFIGWSLYPLITLALIGGLLIFLAIYRPARETMERKFFF